MFHQIKNNTFEIDIVEYVAPQEYYTEFDLECWGEWIDFDEKVARYIETYTVTFA